MKNQIKILLQISSFITLFIIFFTFISLFLYNDFESIKEFYSIFLRKKITNYLFYFYIIFIFIGIFFILYFNIKKIFLIEEKKIQKLKDYNHFLAHELKTPISVISSNLQILKYGLDEKILNKSQEELKNIIKIIDGLLNFSEIIQVTNKKEINVEIFIKSHIVFLERKNDIKIHNKLFNFGIETDDVLFLRIIKNLIENGLKYSINKKLDIYILEDKLIFENKIERNLTKEEIKNILEKFKRKSENNSNGYGLGLAFIKELVKVLNYKLNIISKNNMFIIEIIY